MQTLNKKLAEEIRAKILALISNNGETPSDITVFTAPTLRAVEIHCESNESLRILESRLCYLAGEIKAVALSRFSSLWLIRGEDVIHKVNLDALLETEECRAALAVDRDLLGAVEPLEGS